MSTHTFVRRFLQASLVAVVACVATSGTAAAATSVKTQLIAVHYDDLNLSSPSGVRRLYSRIKVAARVVCGRPSLALLGAKDRSKECAQEAIERAVDDIDNGKLTAMHKSKASRRLG